MIYTTTGTLRAKDDKKTTNNGITVQKFDFEQDNGKIMHPSCLGKKADLLDELFPGDKVEISFYISGSKGHYNNVIADNLTKV